MILPTSYTSAMLVMVMSLVFLGSWANMLKAGRKWRFELFYFDFATGLLLAAVIAAFTLGSMGEELTFEDNLLITGKRNMAYAAAAGIVFNLGNLLIVSAASIAGLSIAFPAGFATAILIGILWRFIAGPGGDPFLISAGGILVGVAIAVLIYSYRAAAEVDGEITGTFSVKGPILALTGGLFLGSFDPLVEWSRAGDFGLGPYSVAFFFAIAVFLSTMIFNLYFMNLPVQGPPVSFIEYFRGSLRNHLAGLFGGILFCAGILAAWVATAAPAAANPGIAVPFGFVYGSAVLTALWGLLFWKEFAGSETRVRLTLVLMMVLLLAGVSLIAISPLDRT